MNWALIFKYAKYGTPILVVLGMAITIYIQNNQIENYKNIVETQKTQLKVCEEANIKAVSAAIKLKEDFVISQETCSKRIKAKDKSSSKLRAIDELKEGGKDENNNSIDPLFDALNELR